MKSESSSKKNNQQPTEKNPNKEAVSSFNVVLSLATAPLLIGIVSFGGLLKTMIEVGKSTEEIFRGERLPLIDVPPQADSEA